MDFVTITNSNITFLYILTSKQLIIQNSLNKTDRFTVNFSRFFIKLDVRYDHILLISNDDDCLLYKINW